MIQRIPCFSWLLLLWIILRFVHVDVHISSGFYCRAASHCLDTAEFVDGHWIFFQFGDITSTFLLDKHVGVEFLGCISVCLAL